MSAKVFDHRHLEHSNLSAQEKAEAQRMLESDKAQRAEVLRSYYKPARGTPCATLSSNHTIPYIGLGTWKAEKGQVAEAVVHAIRAGYRHIDCAAVYQNEQEVGEALNQILEEGVVKREDLFITSKLWNTEHHPSRVEPALRKTLKDLQLDYLDLYLIHWPSSAPGPEISPPLSDVWKAMESLSDLGLAKSIGVSNMSIPKLKGLMAGAKIPPAVNQIEAHPYWHNGNLVKWCQENGVHVTAYSPLGSPDSAGIMGRGADVPSPMQDKVVKEIAARLMKSSAQVMLRWAVQRGTSALPKSTNPGRIEANLEVLAWELSEEDMRSMSTRQPQIRMVPGTFLVHPSGPYMSIDDLWDEPTPSVEGI